MRSNVAVLFGFVASLFVAGCTATPPNGPSNGGGGEGGTTTNPGGNGGATTTTNVGGTGNSGGTGGSAGTGNTSGNTNTGAGGSGCDPGTADCNLDPADGCEVNLQIDVNHCGDCGVTCVGGGGVPPACSVGQCTLACPEGAGDCNMDKNDGCEANLKDDPLHCGTCSSNCLGEPCIEGACACAAETASADLVQLDLFIMLDQSGSMTDVVQGGGTKWDATTTALKGFFNDPTNSGMGAGIQYFALTSGGGACNPLCTVDADCGAFGPCFFGFCLACIPAGGESCNIDDYAKAEVGISLLTPAHAMALSNSINAHMPSTNTPTGPALAGALKHAKQWQMAHPSHGTVVVLATDGDPTTCDPMDIPSIANIATGYLNGSPSIKTFVIGVGASLNNLNAIAAGGGTGQAFLVDTGGNVVDQFKAALEAIQNSALGCEYTIPQPMMGMLDYGKVNVQYTPGNGDPPQTILNVVDAASCDPVNGGWYYDNNANPTKIILCNGLCGSIEIDPGAQVDILLGCATEHM